MPPRLIAGLGNPGGKYQGTRHNAGFMVIDALLEKLPGKFVKSGNSDSEYWKGSFKGRELWLLKPMTYMNLSGSSVGRLMRRCGIEVSELLVVHDDIDLPLGKLRIRKGGSSGGHNGVESIIGELASPVFTRLKLGVGRAEGNKQASYVLEEFSEVEKEIFGKVSVLAADAVIAVICRGVDAAMNTYNRVLVGAEEKKDEKAEKVREKNLDDKDKKNNNTMEE